jgi:hypothetical protein
MPRQFRQDKQTIQLPTSVRSGLTTISEKEETPLAEVIRRVVDYTITLDLLGPSRPIPPFSPADSLERFVLYMPEPMTYNLRKLATAKNVSIDEAVRRGAYFYLQLKSRNPTRVAA